LWAQAVIVAEKNPTPMTGLFIQSLNEVTDLHAKRVTVGMRNRIPIPIWGTLYFTAILAMVGVGYHEGLTSTTRTLATLVLVVTFSGVLWLVEDLVVPLRSPATNSPGVFSEPPAHLVVGPSPVEGVSVPLIVFRPRGQHMLEKLFSCYPRPPLAVASAEGFDQHLCLVQPRGVGRGQPRTPPARAALEV